MKPIYDRRAIMRHANELHRLGMPRSEATKAAWASAKASQLHSRQQEAGIRAALRRYGIDPDRIALRAQEAVRAIVAAIAQDRPALLPHHGGLMGQDMESSIDLTRGEDGVYRL